MSESAGPPATGAPKGPDRDDSGEGAAGSQPGITDSIKTIAGLLAVGAGATAVVIIAVVAIHAGSETAGTVAGAAVAVVGSIVGAYLGVKVGTDQTAKALDQLDSSRKAHEETSKRAERYALHVDKDDASKLR